MFDQGLDLLMTPPPLPPPPPPPTNALLSRSSCDNHLLRLGQCTATVCDSSVTLSCGVYVVFARIFQLWRQYWAQSAHLSHLYILVPCTSCANSERESERASTGRHNCTGAFWERLWAPLSGGRRLQTGGATAVVCSALRNHRMRLRRCVALDPADGGASAIKHRRSWEMCRGGDGFLFHCAMTFPLIPESQRGTAYAS